MNQELEKKIQEQLEKLPKFIKDLLLSKEWRMWVSDIVKKNLLNLDQASSLEQQVFMFLLGIFEISDLRKSIEKELGIPVSKVNDIMIDINDMIVEPLKQKLMDATSDEGDQSKGVPASIATHIQLAKKEEEILDRQKILDEIEQSNHSPEVGVFTPDKNLIIPTMKILKPEIHANEVSVNSVKPNTGTNNINVQPVSKDAQINSAKANPMLANVAPVAKPAKPAQKAPENIFEAKTQGIVAPVSTRSAVEVTDKKSGPDLYRAPVI